MMNSNLEQTLVSTLPDDLIFDNILPRLPVKTLLRFKIVCKLWLSIISSFHFAKSHLKFSSLFPKFVVLARDYYYDSYRFNYDIYTEELFLIHYDENNDVKDSVILQMDPDWKFPLSYFMASCNGLLCFYLEGDPDYFVVWNPATRQCRKIMIPNHEDYIRNFGFTYVSSIDDYKIVAEIRGKGAIFCFSLRSDQWKIIDIDGKYANNIINQSRFYALKDLIHWKEDKCIVGLDLADEKLKEIPLMDWLGRYNWAYFIAIKDNVSLYCNGDHGSDVWVLKQYGDWSSWEKMFSFNFTRTHFWSITETGKSLHQIASEIKVVDLTEGAPDENREGTYVSSDMCDSAVYVESLISPFVFAEPREIIGI